MNQDSEPLVVNEDDMERGGREVRGPITEDFAYRNNVANASVVVRHAFMRKVYLLLACQLFVTIVFCAVGLFVTPVQFFITGNDWLFICSFVSSMVLMMALVAYRRQHPHNLILLGGFTICESVTLGAIVSRYDSITVLEAFLITFVVVVGLTAYTFQTKRDFTKMGAGLFAALITLLLVSIMQVIFGGGLLDILVSGGGALLFSLFIIYDTQLIMEKFSAEEYILATINLYVDIINLFLYILRIIAEIRKNN